MQYQCLCVLGFEQMCLQVKLEHLREYTHKHAKEIMFESMGFGKVKYHTQRRKKEHETKKVCELNREFLDRIFFLCIFAV